MRIAVITCSTRSAAGQRRDVSGPLLVSLLVEAGYVVDGPVVVPDAVEPIRAAVRTALAGDGQRPAADVVLTTGGTGLAPSDCTPEAVRPMLEREVPGIPEALRAASRDLLPTAALSRALAGTVGSALVVTLPGSTGGVRDAVAVLKPLLNHAVDQLRGGDHAVGGAV